MSAKRRGHDDAVLPAVGSRAGTDRAESSRQGPLGRPPMPRERIVDAATELVDKLGADALTLRAVADRLGSSTATLYRHFDSRADLVGLVLDKVLGEIEVDEDALADCTWEDGCRMLALAMFETLSRHHRSALLFTEQIPTGPNALEFRELTVSTLLRHGFSPETAAGFSVTLARFVLGFAMQIRDDEEFTSSAQVGIAPPDPARFPAIATVAAFWPTPLEHEFCFGLDLLILGLSTHR